MSDEIDALEELLERSDPRLRGGTRLMPTFRRQILQPQQTVRAKIKRAQSDYLNRKQKREGK
jgi:hypothetical protein